MSNALAGIIVGTVLLPCLDKYERPVDNVGIWQEDAGTDSLVTFWRVKLVRIHPTKCFNSSILALIQGQLYIPVVSASAGRRKKFAVKLLQMLLV